MAKQAGWRRIGRGERGGTLVEFSIALSALLMAVFGVIDCSRALYSYHFVSYAAQQGARYAMVRGADWPGSCSSAASYDCQASKANIQSYVQGLAPPGITASNVVATPTWPGQTVNGSTTGCSTPAAQGCVVKVQVSYTFHFMLPYLPMGGLPMTATSEQVIAY